MRRIPTFEQFSAYSYSVVNEDERMESAIEKVFKSLGVRASKIDAYSSSAGWVIDLIINNMGKYRDVSSILNDYNDERDHDDPVLSDVKVVNGNKYRFYVKNYMKD